MQVVRDSSRIINELREQAVTLTGWSNEQSAVEGLTARQIRRAEKGEVRPRVATYALLAAAHNQSLSAYLDAVAAEASCIAQV